MAHYLSVAKEEGISEEEIGATLAIVMAVSAGRVNMQLTDVFTQNSDASPTNSCSGSCQSAVS